MTITPVNVLTALLPALNLSSLIETSLWTTGQLYGWADAALRELARTVAAFGESAAAEGVDGSGAVAYPTGAIAVAHVAASGKALRRATVREVECLDRAWTAVTASAPERWIPEGGLSAFRLHPASAGPHSLSYLYHSAGPSITAGETFDGVALCDPYLYWSVLAAARAKDGPAQFPDVAAHAAERAQEIAQVMRAYYGASA